MLLQTIYLNRVLNLIAIFLNFKSFNDLGLQISLKKKYAAFLQTAQSLQAQYILS